MPLLLVMMFFNATSLMMASLFDARNFRQAIGGGGSATSTRGGRIVGPLALVVLVVITPPLAVNLVTMGHTPVVIGNGSRRRRY